MPSELLLFLYGIAYLLIQIGPWWLAGLLAGSVISVYFSEKIVGIVTALRQERLGLTAIVIASLLGIASPLCLFGTIPLIAALGRKGVPQEILAAFMISSIMLNPNLLIMSFALGTPLVLARFFVSLTGGVLAGLITRFFLHGRQLFHFESFELVKQNTTRSKTSRSHHPHHRLNIAGASTPVHLTADREHPEFCAEQISGSSTKKTFWRDFGKGLSITAPYLMIGIILTSISDLYVPTSLISHLFGDNKGLGVLLSTSLSIPTYVCGGGTVPLLAAWLQAGMSPGSAVAYMVAGPATKLTNLGAVKIILGIRYFLVYLVYCLVLAIVSGLLTDWILT